jgi:membrane fusion protein, multidrug efflux system
MNNPAQGPGGSRRLLGRVVGALILIGAVVSAVFGFWYRENRPETNDATVRANFIGIAPSVNGYIVDLPIRDQQEVTKGQLLFVVDPRPYEIALERARAALALTQKEVDALGKAASTAEAGVSRAGAQLTASAADVTSREADPLALDTEIARLDAQRMASEAALRRAEAELKQAEDHVKRVEPLLAEGFATADRVEDLRTRREAAAMAMDQARASVDAARAALEGARVKKRATLAAVDATKAQHSASIAALAQARTERDRAQDTIGQVGKVNVRVAAAEAAVHAAALDLAYCRVTAPFSGRVVNLDISVGAFARAGMDVFTLVDTGAWYVMANFRETQLRHIPAGAPADIYLQSRPDKHFRGTVIGGWAVLPDNATSAMGLPKVEKSIDWVRLAARFPVRVKVEDPDESFRLGASAVVTIGERGARSAAGR